MLESLNVAYKFSLMILGLIILINVSAPLGSFVIPTTLTLTQNTIYDKIILRNDGPIYMNKNISLTIRNSKVVLNGTITGAGNNNLTFVNSTISLYGVKVSGGGGNVVMKNCTMTGLTSGVCLSNYQVNIKGLSLTPKTDCSLLILRGIKNSIIDEFTYNIPFKYISTSQVAVSVEGCSNLTLSHVKGMGQKNVNTPHFHISFASTNPSSDIKINDGYFYGGGNAVTTGPIKYSDCIFDCG